MKIFFIRHGQTDFNKQKIPQGQEIDVGLNDEGVRQVKEALPSIPHGIDIIFSSPLKRARETAQIISAKLGKEIVLRDDIKEFSFGSLAGKPWSKIEQETGGTVTRDKDKALTFDYRPYGGESIEDLKVRVQGFINEVRMQYPDKKILVAAHGGVIGAMHLLYPQKEMVERRNATIHEFEF
jgi:broad specificity phosphatase PhoE